MVNSQIFDSLFCGFLIRLLPDVSGSSLVERVKTGISPFLRCAALFFNCLTGVPPPEELFSISGRFQCSSVRILLHFGIQKRKFCAFMLTFYVLCS